MGTGSPRADWDVLVVLTAEDVAIERLSCSADDFVMSSPTIGTVLVTRADLQKLSVLYISAFCDFVRENPAVMQWFMPRDGCELLDDCEAMARHFLLPMMYYPVSSFTLTRHARDALRSEDLVDMIAAIPTTNPNHLLIVPGGALIKPLPAKNRFLDLAKRRPGLLQVAALLKRLLRTIGADGPCRLPSCVATCLAYEVGMDEGWPAEEDVAGVWPMSELVRRGLEKLVRYLSEGTPLVSPVICSDGDLLADVRWRCQEDQQKVVEEVRELLEAAEMVGPLLRFLFPMSQ